MAAVAEACELVGRDPTTLPLTTCVRLELEASPTDSRPDTLAGDDVLVIAKLQEMHAAGLRHVTFFIGDPDNKDSFPSISLRAIDKLAPIIEALKA